MSAVKQPVSALVVIHTAALEILLIERAAQVPLARKVKLADLQHNMDVSRLPHVGPGEAARLERYRLAWTRLRG